MGVKLSTIVVAREPDARLVERASDLNVRRRTDELGTGDSTGHHDARAMTRLRAVSHYGSLGLTNRVVRSRRAPEAEICLLKI
jgi:hypothetical protein